VFLFADFLDHATQEKAVGAVGRQRVLVHEGCISQAIARLAELAERRVSSV
jgi:hypothetical protein